MYVLHYQRQNYRFAKSNGELHDSSFQGWSKDVPWTSFQAPQEFHNWAKGAWCPELPVWQAGKAWLRTWADLWSSPEQVSQQPSTCHNPQTGPCRIRPYLSCKYIKYNCRHRLPTKGVTWFCWKEIIHILLMKMAPVSSISCTNLHLVKLAHPFLFPLPIYNVYWKNSQWCMSCDENQSLHEFWRTNYEDAFIANLPFSWWLWQHFTLQQLLSLQNRSLVSRTQDKEKVVEDDI